MRAHATLSRMSTDAPLGPSSLAEQRRLCGIEEVVKNVTYAFKTAKAMQNAMYAVDDAFGGRPPSYSMDDGWFGKTIRFMYRDDAQRKKAEAVMKKRRFKFTVSESIGEAKPPWEGDIATRDIKRLRSALWDVASDLSDLGARFRNTLKIVDDRLMKVHSHAAAMKQYSRLKAALKKLDSLEAELRTVQGEFSDLGAHVK